ncbi:MAG: tryptophan--tRNA ligase [Verrucomicrobiae bacterium]|nr:tryptophan--tRNA ligase [Verrucomicrobiae bacterium]
MRILSGIQPSGALHLGNYLGMMRPAIELQEQGDAYYFIADLHALTTVQDAAAMRANSRDVALDFLACGLDPKRAVFYRQSDVPEVTELAWLLSVITPMSLLEKCHSYKDKTAKGIAASHGLFAYPVLMAADILIVDANVVPVGRDQKQHVEVTRDLAIKFNLKFGEVFVVPETRIRDEVAVVPGTDGQKMSKSYGNTLEIFLDEETLKKKVMGIVSDSQPLEAPKQGLEENAAWRILKLVAPPSEFAEMDARLRAGGTGWGDLKKKVFGCLWEMFAPARKRRAEFAADLGGVERLLAEGAVKARTVARRTLDRARNAAGLNPLAEGRRPLTP